MSKDVNRAQVFKSTKVRTSLKGDGSWIHKAKKTDEEEETPRRTDSAVETRPLAVRQNSYVLSTAKKFESVASPVSPSFSPAEGDSVNHANIEVIPTKTDAQPEKSIVETTEDTKPQTPTKDVIQNGPVETYPTAPPEPAAEAAVKSVESKTESAAKAEPVLETGVEDVVKWEVQSADEAVVEQSDKPTPDTATDHKMESNVEVAVEPVPESVAEAVRDQLAERPIELAEAIDVEPSRAPAVPEPVEHKESHSEELRLNQESDSTNTGLATEIVQEPVVDPQTPHTLSETSDAKAICSYCDKTIEGNVKIMLNYPPVSSHPECLKCGVCGWALGDMLTAMFLHGQVIHCKSCFAKTL